MTEASDGPTVFDEALAALEGTAEQAEPEGGEVVESPSEEVSEPEPESAEEPSTQKLKVKVNGVEQEIDLDEAAQGYQRQEDYTRKTQELAAERERLAQEEAIFAALKEDPKGTLEWLQEQFLDEDAVDPADLDPLERDLLEVKTFVQQQQEAQFELEIHSEVDRIKTQFNDPDLTFEELLTHATEREIGNLEAAYKDLRFDSYFTDRQAATQTQRDAEDAVAQEAKRAAAVVSGGTSRTQGNTDSGGPPKSIREAFAQAAKEHGVEF